VAGSAAVGRAGCGGSDTAATNVWRVGTDASYAPFGFQDEKSHEYVGFDIDIIRAIGEAQGREVTIKNLNFDGLIPALQTGDLDIAISDMTINEERARTVDFTDSYYKAGLSMVVRADETRINSFDDLQGLRVGVTIGSTGAEVARGIPNANLHEFSTISDAFLDLYNGGVDAVAAGLPAATGNGLPAGRVEATGRAGLDGLCGCGEEPGDGAPVDLAAGA